jgi:hypothetical protein
MANGITVMAQRFGQLFSQILNHNVDGRCADIFLQFVVFGEEKDT